MLCQHSAPRQLNHRGRFAPHSPAVTRPGPDGWSTSQHHDDTGKPPADLAVITHHPAHSPTRGPGPPSAALAQAGSHSQHKHASLPALRLACSELGLAGQPSCQPSLPHTLCHPRSAHQDSRPRYATNGPGSPTPDQKTSQGGQGPLRPHALYTL
jgi:hypothetical protein